MADERISYAMVQYLAVARDMGLNWDKANVKQRAAIMAEAERREKAQASHYIGPTKQSTSDFTS